MKEWKNFLLKQEKILGKETTDKWLASLKVVKFDACNLYLEAQNSFQVTWFEEHIRAKIKKELYNNNDHPIKVHIKLSNFSAKPNKKFEKTDSSFTFSINQDSLYPQKNFSNFIEDDNNLMVYKLVRSLIDTSKDAITLGTYNPIFLYGPKGCGKTHLLMACASAFKDKGLSIFYVHAETFTSHVVQAIRLGQMKNFRNIYRNIDVLLIDDIHILAKKSATQEEFFHTFNTLHTSGCQIILTSHLPPTQLSDIEPRLISRFDWGISIKILPLSSKSFKEAVIKKAKFFDLNLNQSQLDFFISHFPNNLEGIQKALEALVLRLHLSSEKQKLSSEILSSLLYDLIEKEKKPVLTFENITNAVTKYFGIKKEDILGKSQTRECVLPRQIAMYLCRHKLKLPYKKIGDHFHRDHSTVMSAIQAIIKESSKQNNKISFQMKEILKELAISN